MIQRPGTGGQSGLRPSAFPPADTNPFRVDARADQDNRRGWRHRLHTKAARDLVDRLAGQDRQVCRVDLFRRHLTPFEGIDAGVRAVADELLAASQEFDLARAEAEDPLLEVLAGSVRPTPPPYRCRACAMACRQAATRASRQTGLAVGR